MKYAFIIGSNAFVVRKPVISYVDNGEEKDFLKINSIYHGSASQKGGTHLDIDLDIKDIDGTPVFMMVNLNLEAAPYKVKIERDSIEVLRTDGSLIIHVHQLDDVAAMNLEHYIIAELEVNMPIAVIRINGDFVAGNLNISAENEKLYINDIGYANSASAGNDKLKFTSKGVVL
jgi:hypothetical protein